MATNKGQNVRALVESVGLDTRNLNEGDLSALTLSHSEQYSTNDFEAYTSISGDLECMNAEEVMTTDEEHVVIEQESETEGESVLPDVEMADVSDNVQNEQIIYTTANQHNQNLIFQTKPTLQRVPVSTIQMKSHVGQPTQSQSFMIVSPAGGQGNSQILKISHPSGTSPGQLQSLAQTLITAKSADGNIVQLRSAQPTKPIMTTTQSGTITLGNVQGVKTIQSSSIKRPNQTGHQNRNVYTKMILAGNQSQTGQVLFTSQGESQQAIKIISNNSSQSISNPTKTITLAQAQQMGLLGPSKVQHILPSSTTQKQGIIVNKLMPSSGSASKMTIVSNSIKSSPAKILPAPTLQTKTISSSPTLVSKGNMQHQTAQKVIIRQSSLKPGAVLGGGQVIRIPANQNIVTSNQVHQIQMPGRQVQYVRLVSTPATGTSNVVTVGKAKPQATLQTVGVHQKIGPQPQIVKAIRSVTPKGGPGQRLLIPSVGGQGKSAVAIPASALSQLASGQAVISGGSNVGNIVVLPAQYLQQKDDLKLKTLHQSTSSLLNSSQGSIGSPGNISITSFNESKMSQRSAANAEPNGIRPRKPCNCTKSQCLKLYCDCFANGEFCHMCNCNNCSNNLGNEEERQRAIKSCLERNPNAFRPKIGKGRDIGEDIVRRHTKGCNCKRSGCLKNYCECYEAKIPCSANCKCIGCRNVEETLLTKKSLKDLADAAEVRTAQLTLNKAKMQQYLDSTAFRPAATSNTGARQPFNFLTDKVVEITCQCLMAQADDAERNMIDEETSQKLIIEEFGRCLKEIIESADKAENI